MVKDLLQPGMRSFLPFGNSVTATPLAEPNRDFVAFSSEPDTAER